MILIQSQLSLRSITMKEHCIRQTISAWMQSDTMLSLRQSKVAASEMQSENI